MDKPKPSQDEKGRFITGNIGGGRPKGSRNALGEAFLADMHADWLQNGREVIERVRTERPQDYLKVTASILPKELKIESDNVSKLSDDELGRLIDLVRTAAGDAIGSAGGTDETDGAKPSPGLSPLH